MRLIPLAPLLALLSFASSPSFAISAEALGKSETSLFTRVSSRYQAVLQGVSFYYYTQADRLQILTELFHSVELDYSLLEMKANRFRLDLADMKRQALAEETAIADTSDEGEQAAANLRFLDRAKKIVATFQDTHFRLRGRVRPGAVLLPFKIAKAEGKYIVSARYTKLMAFLALTEPAFSEVELGQEVVSIDGMPVEQAKTALAAYISASSEGARELDAVAALTFRSFAYPEQAYSIVGLRAKNGSITKLKVPWSYGMPSRGDLNRYLKDRGFFRFDELQLAWDEEKKEWKAKGITLDNEEAFRGLPPLAQEEKFFDGYKETVVKTGYLINGGKAYAVLQINSFHEKEVVSAKDEKLKFLSVLRKFIKKAERAGTSLILDLRVNGGGNSSYPSALLSMLAPKGSIYAGPTGSFRMTRYAQAIIDQHLDREMIPEVLKGLTEEEMRKLFADAVRNKDAYTAAYSTGDIQTDPEVGGFSQKVVALISPECVSACDMTAILLKHSGRAVLIGSPTNGTGAGFMSNSSLNSEWMDSYKVLWTNVPNFLFGFPGGKPGEFTFPGQAEALNSENKPVAPDVAYESTSQDLLQGSEGWIKKAFEILDAK